MPSGPWSAAKSTKASAQRRGQRSSPSRRSKRAEPSQSRRASSRESRIPHRRCSAESTQKMPPSDQNAWPPRFFSFSWSTMTARTPRCVASNAATNPASPPPTIITGSTLPAAFVFFEGIARLSRLYLLLLLLFLLL